MARVSEEDLREDLRNKTARLEMQNQAAMNVGTVQFIGNDQSGNQKAVVKVGGTYVEVMRALDVEAGESVTLHPMTQQIVERSVFKPMGEIVTISEIMSDDLVEVESHNGPRVANGDVKKLKLEKGCRVVLDSSSSVVILNKGKAAGEYSRGETGVTWDDIGGLDDVKRKLVEAVELPHRHPDLYKSYGMKAPKGIALEGPPGCGKTMLGKAVATAIAQLHGADVKKGLGSGFLYVKGPEVLTKWVGEAERTIREIFDRARAHTRDSGYPAVLFIDEAESLLSKRGTGVSSDMEKTIVPMFLAEMDGLDASSVIVIIATNRVDRIDPAVLRDGRIDWKIRVTRPTVDDVMNIVALNLRDRPIANKASAKQLARFAADELFSADRVVSTHRKGKQSVQIMLSDLATGAMAANLVSLSVRNALRRDVEAGVKKNATGLNAQDVSQAVDELLDMNRFIDHADVLAEVLEAAQAEAEAERAAPMAVSA